MLKKSDLKKNGIAIYTRLLKVAGRYWPLFLIGVLGTVMGSGIDAGLTYLIKPVINRGLIARDQEFIHWLPLGIIVIFLLRGVGSFLSDYFITRVGRNVVMQFRQEIFAHLLKMPAYFYDKQNSGQLLSTIIYNVEQVAQASTDSLMIIIQEGVLAVGLLIVMFTISWQLSLMFLIAAPMMTLIFHISSKRTRYQSSKVQETMAHVTHVAQEGIDGYKVIRTFGGEQYETEKFNLATKLNRQREMKVIVINSLGSSGVQLIASAMIALILLLATSNYLAISAGGFAAMLAATFALLRPIRRLTQVNNKIQKGIAGAESVFELLDRPAEKDHGDLSLTRASGHIEYRDVSFVYPETEREVLHQINFSVKPGEIIALVGKSGSGKSTLVNLLPRFYDLNSGSLLVDGIDVKKYQLADLRSQFAQVSQNVTLFNDTIARNIAYGRFSEVSEAEIIRVAEAAHAMEFIKYLPQGIHTLVGENGVLLSGGQRQRLAIARAILKNAPILILDEATSALDTESERHIQAALEDLMQNRTTLIIAHRLSTIEKANRIIVLDHGRIVETGTHQELLAHNGYYARLHAMQFREETSSLILEAAS